MSALATPSFSILQTCFSSSWGGLEMQALEIADQLQHRGHRVVLACCAGTRLDKEAALRALPVLPVNVSGYLHPGAICLLRKCVADRQIDIVHSHLSRDLATLVPALFLARRRIPLVLSKRVGSGISKRDPLHRLTYARVTMVLAVSSVIHQNVLDTTPVTPDRVLTLHDAIDTTLFSPHPSRETVRSELHVAPGTVILGFVGRFSPGKGLEELLEALARLRGTSGPFHLVIVGEASFGEEAYGESIRQLCTGLGLDDLVTFTGFRQDIPALLSAFDVFAFPSHAESFGVALIEAMAMQLPVVSTNCDGVLDIVVDGETGLFVHPRQSGELAAALGRLIGDAALRHRLGEAGRRRVMMFFDRAKQLDRLEEVYRQLHAAARSGATKQ
jgi:glycosyltransferase involved in cell wall biosynthesis